MSIRLPSGENGTGKLWPWWPTLPLVAPLLHLSAVRVLKDAPLTLIWLFSLYALTTLAAAILSPTPNVAMVLSITRLVWTGAMLGLGLFIGRAQLLGRMDVGLIAVYLTAIASALISGRSPVGRLDHPFFMPTSLALAGAVGVWIAAFTDHRPVWWRWALGISGFGIVVMTGSRIGLLALVLGTALSLTKRGVWASGLLLIAALPVGLAISGISGLGRLSDFAASGRSLVWHDAFDVIVEHPWSGVGPYLAGGLLKRPDGSCEWFTNLTYLGASCPKIVDSLGNPWVIAHNFLLQQWMESGTLGLFGLISLMTYVLWAMWQSGQPLLKAIAVAAVVANVTDNVTMIPSPFFAEFMWIAAGISVAELSRHLALVPPVKATNAVGLWLSPVAAGLLLVLFTGLPLWGRALSQSGSSASAPVKMVAVLSPSQWRPEEPYGSYVEFSSTQNSTYRLVQSVCDPVCRTVSVQPLAVVPESRMGLWVYLPPTDQPAAPVFDVRLQLLPPGDGPTDSRPLLSHRWTVREIKP